MFELKLSGIQIHLLFYCILKQIVNISLQFSRYKQSVSFQYYAWRMDMEIIGGTLLISNRIFFIATCIFVKLCEPNYDFYIYSFYRTSEFIE